VTAKPEEGRAWGTGTEVVWSLGSGATNNAMLQNQYFQVLDAAGKYKYTGPTAFGTTAHRMIGCSNAGALALSIDGTLVTTTTDNGGTGAMATPPTTLYFGGLGASLYFGGYLKNLKICSAKNAKECK
jgi:hypothetical protein